MIDLTEEEKDMLITKLFEENQKLEERIILLNTILQNHLDDQEEAFDLIKDIISKKELLGVDEDGDTIVPKKRRF